MGILTVILGFIFQRKRKIYLKAKRLELLKDMTMYEKKAEKILRHFGIPFYKQQILGYYIADFVGRDRNFVLEIDGKYHDEGKSQEHDEKRDYYLRCHGFRIIRIANLNVDKKIIKSFIFDCPIVGTKEMESLIKNINVKNN